MCTYHISCLPPHINTRCCVRVANNGTQLYIRTNEGAPQYKIISVDLADKEWKHVDVIPEDKDAHLEDVRAVNGDRFAVVYKRNVSMVSKLIKED